MFWNEVMTRNRHVTKLNEIVKAETKKIPFNFQEMKLEMNDFF